VIRTRKQFAQHWLKSEKALDRIVQAAEIQQSDRILEIGPGTGVLTRRLLPLASSVENFLLLQGDFLNLDLATLLAPLPNFQKPNKVVANIPYNITGPILEKLLGTIAEPNPEPYESIVLLVQKEVADRLYAKPESKAFGALSVRVQYLAACEQICIVPAGAFQPPPKVDSAVVRLRPRTLSTVANNPKQLEALVKIGFSAKRKMLRNNLKAIVDSDRLNHLLQELNINPQARAEDLSVTQWVNLSNGLGDG
jgi:16S rRNA (adenine1518-N6/adenine1519-N6)-dimethyltransferase